MEPVPARRTVPRWPTVVLAAYAALGTVTILQGVADLAIPALTGARPFGFLFDLLHVGGAPAFGAYIFLHNLGLACLVPGFGFVAVRFERHPPNRRIIAALLAGSVVVALAVGAAHLVQASAAFDLWFAVPLFVGEAIGVLLLALPAARELARVVPTRRYEWALLTPLRRLAPAFLASAALLAVLSVVETRTVLGL